MGEILKFNFKDVQCINECKNFEIEVGKINIKFGRNGIGKSSIGKCLDYYFNNKDLSILRSYGLKIDPEVHISNPHIFTSCLTFNKDFIDKTLFQKNCVINNYNDIFFKNDEYINTKQEISDFINDVFNDPSLERGPIDRYIDYTSIEDNFSNKDHSQLDQRKTLYNGLKRCTDISLITTDIVKEYLSCFFDLDDSVSWLEWRNLANSNWEKQGKCPYCGQNIDIELMEKIRLSCQNTVSDINTDKYKEAKVLLSKIKNRAINVDKEIIDRILSQDCAPSPSQILELYRIQSYVQIETNKITKFKLLANEFDGDKSDIRKFCDDLRDNKLNLDLFKDINDEEIGSQAYYDAAIEFNNKIDLFFEKCDSFILAAEKVNQFVTDSIDKNQKQINDFLKISGIPYIYKVEGSGEDRKTKIYAISYADSGKEVKVDKPVEHLSYGECNSLSMALFGAIAETSKDSLIVLDDPISSFDENKKYAVLHFLFNKYNGVLKDKTVVMLTHDMEPIIDLVKQETIDTVNPVNAYFIERSNINSNDIVETQISKEQIMSSYYREKEFVKDTRKDPFIRMVHLRRLLDLECNHNSNLYYVVSGAIKLYKMPCYTKRYDPNYQMDIKDLNDAESIICKRYNMTFSYEAFVNSYNDFTKLFSYYDHPSDKSDNLEQLAIFRIIVEFYNSTQNDGSKVFINDVMFNFINEVYHIENLPIFVLYGKYQVPSYIMRYCDDKVKELKEILNYDQ